MKLITFIALLFYLSTLLSVSGCAGLSQKQWRELDSVLEKAESADCYSVQMYVSILRNAVKDKLK
jgi:hypothetical protein